MNSGKPSSKRVPSKDNIPHLHPGNSWSSEETTNDRLRVVGIGASAGGLEALELLFGHLPVDTGMAFVVIQHLSPDFVSMMNELLSRHTSMEIHRVSDRMAVKPNCVYLIPPKKEMIISDGQLLLSDKDPKQLSLPIDTFFRSLAQECGDRAVGIVLSGTGSDGSRGIQKISSEGGIVIVQDEESCRFDGMPKAAIETGIVDIVLRPEEMGEVLAKTSKTGILDNLEKSESGLNGVFELLRNEYGIDFSWYKSSTVDRRVERRIQMLHVSSLDDYLRVVREDREELNNLYKDLLIGVTKFFRDPQAFDRLAESVIPGILENLEDQEEARFWVAGCATGEEAYSLAILIDEQLRRTGKRIDVKIFATDVHKNSLQYASAGLYPASSMTELSEDRLSRYFTSTNGCYQVAPELRKLIVFSPHNLLKDAPFTRMHLISCRNLLIYFQPAAQKKVLSLFHFALTSSGILFLGPSEGLLDLGDEFDPIDRSWKIYRKRRDIRLTQDFRMSPTTDFSLRSIPRLPRRDTKRSSSDFVSRAYELLAQDYLPPSFLVDESYELLYSFPGAVNFLAQRGGAPSTAILDLVDEDLRVVLAGALQRSSREKVAVSFSKISIQDARESVVADLTVRPLSINGSKTLYLISIVPLVSQEAGPVHAVELHVDESVRERMRLLESDLRHTKENLQAAIEELETSNEELQAANEELVASNEELQSTNEELHSVNEELYTVNGEYQRKIEELVEVNEDIDNLFRSTDVASIFLDPSLSIRKFTPQATRIFHVTPQDIGRRIDGFVHNLNYDKLFEDIQAVATGNKTKFEKDVLDKHGGWHLLRVIPYQSNEFSGGVVVSIFDIDSLKQAQTELRIAKDAINASINGVLLTDLDWRIRAANPAFLNMFEFEDFAAVQGQRIIDLFATESVGKLKEICDEISRDEQPKKHEYTIRRKDGTAFHVEVAGTIFSDERETPSGRQLSFVDITRRRQAEEARESYSAQLEMANETLRAAELNARDAVEKRDQFLAILSHELRNPLGGIQNAVRVLNHKGADEKKTARAKSAIASQTRQMARLMNDLLDVSRVTQGKINFDLEVLDSCELIEDAVDNVQSSIHTRKQSLKIERPDSPLFVEADRDRLLQVLNNLLTNASRYTQPGGEITLRLEKRDVECFISVIDNGIGIEPELKDGIFEMFVQSDSTLERTDGGMGVGLTLVKSLTEKMGGAVEADSKGTGQGSSFTVRLPLTLKNPPDGSAHPERTIKLSREYCSSKRVLIVEDNNDAREMLKYLLDLDGFQVLQASDGRSGLDLVLSEQPDFAFVDIGLPELNGFQVARQICKKLGDDRRTKLVALTGYGQMDDHIKVMDAGFDEHLVKPVDGKELNRVLAETLKSKVNQVELD